MIQDKISVMLQTLQGLPFVGDHLVAGAASGTRVLAAAAVCGLCVLARGWFNVLFSSAEERAKLHEGNPAFVVNQLFVTAAFVFALGAALVNTASIPAYLEKVAVALIVQIVAMIAIRVIFRKAHHQMLHGNVGAGVRLGAITMLVGILTAFEMLR